MTLKAFLLAGLYWSLLALVVGLVVGRILGHVKPTRAERRILGHVKPTRAERRRP